MRRDVYRAASLRTDPSIYALYGIICAQRRQSDNASAHGIHIKGCSFGRSSEQILRWPLRMTMLRAEGQREGARKDSGLSLRHITE